MFLHIPIYILCINQGYFPYCRIVLSIPYSIVIPLHVEVLVSIFFHRVLSQSGGSHTGHRKPESSF